MPSPQRPEKINVGSIGWESGTQEFVVQLEARFGVATAGTSAGFATSTTLTVTAPDGSPLATLGPSGDPVRRTTDDNPGGGEAVPIAPTRLAWDRNGGTFSGPANVSASTRLLGPSGSPVDGAQGELTVESLPIDVDAT